MFELGKVLQRMPSIMAHLASDHIIEHPTFKRALKKIMDDGYCGLRDDPKALDLLDHLREFFGRWRDNKTDDHLWERIAADAEHRGLSRTQSYYRIAAIAFEASLIAGHPENPENISPKTLREMKARLDGLAESAAALADWYRSDEIFANEKLARSLNQEEKHFRLISDLFGMALGVASPQRHGKKFAREHLTFMRSLAHYMRREFGRPYYEACAALTNLAYPRKTVATGEDVRLAYRTRRGTR
jgi:hypothetical protein